MRPVSPVIKGHIYAEKVFAEHQPEYNKLPAIEGPQPYGVITSRWHMTWRERLTVLIRGDVYLQLMTFDRRCRACNQIVGLTPSTITAAPPKIRKES